MQRYLVSDDSELAPEMRLPPLDAVPEDAVSELDREARLADAERELEQIEGQLPAETDYVE